MSKKKMTFEQMAEDFIGRHPSAFYVVCMGIATAFTAGCYALNNKCLAKSIAKELTKGKYKIK